MKTSAILLFAIFLSDKVFCQSSLTLPKYKNSISLELNNPAGYAREIIDPDISVAFPSVTLSGEFRINKKFYGEFGFIPFGEGAAEVNRWEYENYNKTRTYYALYAGGLMKFRVINHFYFTPSLDLYFHRDKYKEERNNFYLGLGPSFGFEYFVSNRISLKTEIMGMSLGFLYDKHSSPGLNPMQNDYPGKHLSYGIYKGLSLGIHYNFGGKK